MQSVTTGPNSKHIGQRRAPEALSCPQSWWPDNNFKHGRETLEISVLIKSNLLWARLGNWLQRGEGMKASLSHEAISLNTEAQNFTLNVTAIKIDVWLIYVLAESHFSGDN